MDYKIRISPPHMGGEELKYIKEALATNWVASSGRHISDFEKDLESYLGGQRYVAALSSGTAAIHLALILAGVQRDDEVICQSLTFAASAFPIVYQGAKPIFVDSEQDTWNLCPSVLEETIQDRLLKGKKPKAIIVVHIFGMPAKMDEIKTVSKKYNIPLIEDAAEALGSSYKGHKCGCLGDFGILSFNGNKIITTSGGGALICKEAKQKDRAIFLATQAKDEALWYAHSTVGYNYRMSNIAAGIGRGQMEALSVYSEKRRENHLFYKNLFEPFDYIQVFSETNAEQYANHWLTCIQFSPNKANKSAMGLLHALGQQGIESKPIWKPMHLQPLFKGCPYYGDKVAETIFKTGLSLPSGYNLNKEDREYIHNGVKNYLNH
ncbi:aminotransferase class I/II-fold pyridoxal phosphate-dependent enzyme [Aestuariivivens sediminicola]|uniref:aminotransferase class I/II-fold pyridoxal phosphate-dependent enzyme n=1 Tax=Aestuariivivens sediminicola TaxID=2913560 RepID=UPI001F5AF2F0|nr:aminotransferase class I/II-fold pyridoxal phosphate-dependent enzyme [Aestuariivivens sediminicola]